MRLRLDHLGFLSPGQPICFSLVVSFKATAFYLNRQIEDMLHHTFLF